MRKFVSTAIALVAFVVASGAPAQAEVQAGYTVDDGVVVTISGGTATASNIIPLLPQGAGPGSGSGSGSGSGILPRTGSAAAAWLVAVGVLLAAAGGVLLVQRRRA
ncbi:MAG: LPXTG cell wall anchor domain-containing protein [Aeromicrobium sp.]|uniref:LPXTG cell wall anchor domain-containing protein n=1 Tax=Aeromicrobium sp. TaxID=1871063 RepID=UPI0025BEB4EF|nr:LPXTG cell wall anchor domain-containing protein [Aeromicrobium sp.]MCK5891412.1 LPXTG cell wall anchor domain-containing protein [Aeromicrobium sp.]MDF1704442.1 LPXTG cell wall anchor domain-containing protein [Aeromicrobium sp.]